MNTFECIVCSSSHDGSAYAIDENGFEYCEECAHDELCKCDNCGEYYTNERDEYGAEGINEYLIQHGMTIYCLDCARKLVGVPNEQAYKLRVGDRAFRLIERLIRAHTWAQKPFYSCGDDACFRKLNDKYGYKIFRSEYERNENFFNQRAAARYGLAPKIGGRFEYFDRSNRKVYGFVTGVAEMQNHYNEHSIMELCMALRLIDSSDFDMHSGNIGVYNGRLVKIDFSK